MHPFIVVVKNSDRWDMAGRETVMDLLNAKERVFGITGIVVCQGPVSMVELSWFTKTVCSDCATGLLLASMRTG